MVLTYLLLACATDVVDPVSAASPKPRSVAMADLKASTSQDVVARADHVAIQGTLAAPCAGVVRVDLVEHNAQPGALPVTALDLWPGATEFRILAPEGHVLGLTAVCDRNADGLLDSENDQVAAMIELDNTPGVDQTGLALQWLPMSRPAAAAIGLDAALDVSGGGPGPIDR